MKDIFILSILTALLGGCAVAPGYGDRERGFNPSDRKYREYNDGNYRHYSSRGEHANQTDPSLHVAALRTSVTAVS
jgi:hypothetical protein